VSAVGWSDRVHGYLVNVIHVPYRLHGLRACRAGCGR
jgi:hypothetical protein